MKEKFNQKKLLFSSILFLCLLIVLGLILLRHKKHSYIDTIEDWRSQKDDFFQNNPDSPLENKDDFPGLSYFPPNESYKVIAKVQRSKDSTFVTINKNDGRKERYAEYGIATFKLKKKEYSLTLYKLMENEDNSDLLFLPFSDRSNDEGTYVGGRYLDIELQDSSKVEIDFNKAYNPFCIYNPRYSCPIPPQKNYLDIPILAGEKTYIPIKTNGNDSAKIK